MIYKKESAFVYFASPWFNKEQAEIKEDAKFRINKNISSINVLLSLIKN